MPYKKIPLSELVVNIDNDRHGSVEDEPKAIKWHFIHLGTKAIKLANDIVNQGIVYEPPLVSENNGSFIVHDGNRRVTCLKALINPDIIHDESVRKQFTALKERANLKLFQKIECRIETSQSKIDEIVHRRHTGGASGVGQVKWGAIEKENHLRRIGKADTKNIGYVVTEYAQKHKLIDKDKKVPTSTVQRLLSSTDIRERIGIKIEEGIFSFLRPKKTVHKTLRQILEDFMCHKVVLKDVWTNDDKHRYLDSLMKEGYAVIQKDKTTKKKTTRNIKRKNLGARQKRFVERKTLIPKELDVEINFSKMGLNKIRRVWEELQFKLYINQTPCAIGISFRCLLELSTEKYISCNKVRGLSKELHLRIKSVAHHMEENDFFDKKYCKQIEKLANSEETISVRTFHEFVHSKHFIPSEHNLRTLWENFEVYIVSCLKK